METTEGLCFREVGCVVGATASDSHGVWLFSEFSEFQSFQRHPVMTGCVTIVVPNEKCSVVAEGTDARMCRCRSLEVELSRCVYVYFLLIMAKSIKLLKYKRRDEIIYVRR